MKIKVTERHIELGLRNMDANKCIIFRAMRSAGIKVTTVGMDNFTIDGRSIPLTKRVYNFINRAIGYSCDFGRKPKPFSFNISDKLLR